MILTEENYYSPEMNQKYFSVSQYKSFLRCEAAALAELRGEWRRPESRALLLGSLVDEMLTGDPESQDKFIQENYGKLFKKNGEGYNDVTKAFEAVAKVQKQPLMMNFFSGEHQRIMTGKISGVPFKIKMDGYKPGEFISDLKYMASLKSPNFFQPMIEYWNYALQGAVYQEIVYQNTGERLPFYLILVTKETPPHLEVCKIEQYKLDEELANVKKRVERFQKIKLGEIEAERCEEYDCNYCTETKVLTTPVDSELIGLSTRQIKAMRGEL